MKMKTAKLFQNGQSQAVRLPKEFRFEGAEVFIKKSGSAVVLIPLVNSWDSLIGSLDKFTKDYMADRNQPRRQERRYLNETHARYQYLHRHHQAKAAARVEALQRLQL